MNYYAHTLESSPETWQLLHDHLTGTAERAAIYGGQPGIGDFAYLAGYLHDIGKYSAAFQRRLHGSKTPVDHATAGAQEIYRLAGEHPQHKAIADILAYCIAGHHSGLPDYGSQIDTGSDSTLWGRKKKRIEDYSAYTTELADRNLTLPSKLPIRINQKLPGFGISFFVRMLYSCLVDADFIDTESFVNGEEKSRGRYFTLDQHSVSFDAALAAFGAPASPINLKRNQILQNCINLANMPPGYFTLTVPTGGGKTIASMAFALQHARTHNKQRIIYVIPYTSIIEQNAAVFKNILGEDEVLEHHANFDWREDSNDEDGKLEASAKLRLAAENWDIPVVVTTNVQFFESLYANRSSRSRKLHNIRNSVVIFDEAQMLPRAYMKPCLAAIDELVRNYGVSAVFCTATQPSLHVFLPPDTSLRELAPDPSGLYQFFRRVQVRQVGKLTDEQVVEQLNQHGQVLCIVNTRKHAKGLFEGLQPDGRFHLSTLMCPVHRQAVIRQLRDRLKEKATCRVVSTQIMEAGIDVDFPVGYRAIAGLDSIIQAAGRVNREGKRSEGYLHVFEPDSEFVKRMPSYIQQGVEVAHTIFRQFADPLSIEAIDAYFALLYDLSDPKAFDQKDILGCFDKHINALSFDFKTAAERFRMIESNTVPVIIPYDETVIGYLETLRWHPYPHSFSRRLQPYCVNIYEQEFERLQSAGYIDQVAETFQVLNQMEQYDQETGLNIPASIGGDAVFFD